MKFEGFIPYKTEDARLYDRKRWWLGLTLGDMFDKSADLYPNKEALVGSGKRYTYGQLRRLVDRLSYRLHREGFRPGDKVLLQLPNWPEFYIAYFALQKAGLVAVLLTVNHSAREISHVAEVTQPKGWILPAGYRKTDYVPVIKRVQEENPLCDKVIIVGDTVPDGFLSFDALLETEADDREVQRLLESVRPDPGDVCQIMPSGGTTGLPKAIPRTHNDYICNIEYTSTGWDLNVRDVCLVATPVGHNLALAILVGPIVFHGGKLVMLDSSRPADFCAAVEQEGVTCTGVVPTLIIRVINFDKLGDYDFGSMQRVYVGASHSPPELVTAVEKKLGCRYINAFGMAEGPCAESRPDDPLDVTCNTVGKPVCPYDDFRTLNQEGKPTPRGVEGELAAKGPGVFTGYFKNPKANETAFTPDGYFRTGDLAVIDEAGNIKITGRIKDIIIRGGENINAQEVEELISSHPSVEYVSVIGMPHPDLGEEVCAYIKTVEGAFLATEEICEHLGRLGASKIVYPARVELVQQMPLTAAGKIDKKALRKDIQEKLKA